jgi:hypothetical protein
MGEVYSMSTGRGRTARGGCVSLPCRPDLSGDESVEEVMRRQMGRVAVVAALGAAMATAPGASAQTATDGSHLAVPVEVELIEQAVCTIDEDSFLMSLVMRTTYSNTGVRPLFLSRSSERVSSITFAPGR